MTDLVTWLKEQIDEDERVAQIPWWPSWEAGGYRPSEWCVAGEGRTLAIGWKRDLEHMARHDPARVLRQVKAFREMLTGYENSIWGGEADAYREVVTSLAAIYSDRPGYAEVTGVSLDT